MLQLERNHPSETLHRTPTAPPVPTKQATIEWILGMRYLSLGRRTDGIRHLLKAANWLDRAGAPHQARRLRIDVELLCKES